MNLPPKIKYSSLFILSLFVFSCSSDDGLDKSLLYGDWFEVERCENQNILTFNPNGSYTWLRSGNEDCENNEYSTSQTTGNFTVFGYNLILTRDTFEIIDPGEHITEIVLVNYTSSRVLTLTANTLEIEISYRNDPPSLPDVKLNYVFYR